MIFINQSIFFFLYFKKCITEGTNGLLGIGKKGFLWWVGPMAKVLIWVSGLGFGKRNGIVFFNHWLKDFGEVGFLSENKKVCGIEGSRRDWEGPSCD